MSGHGHDDWFRHGGEEGLPQAEHAAHVSPAALGVTFVAITFGVLAVILILSLYFTSYTTHVRSTRQEGTASAEAYLSYRAEAKSALARTAWIDREKGVVRLPIDRAMDMVVAEYAGADPSVTMSGE